MDSIPRDQVDKLAEDIAFVKQAIQKSTSILRQIDLPSSVRLVTLLSSLAIFLYSGLFHLLIKHYKGFSGIPLSIKAVAICSMVLIVLGLGFLKNSGLLKSVRTLEPGASWTCLVWEYYSFRIFHHYIPMGFVIIFACAFAAATGHARLIIPFLSIGIGLIYNNIDNLLKLDEVSWASYWFILSGCVVMVFGIPTLLGLCLTIGCGMLLLSAIWYLPRKKRVEG